jgi:hypothetical protein
MHRSLIAVVAGIVAISVVVGAVPASAARTAAPSFELTAEGLGWDSFVAEGEFTALGAFCPAGSIQEGPIGVHVLTCADGSGTATVRLVWPSEWRIVGGTGRYEKLRGQGTFTSVVTGDHEVVCDEFAFEFELPCTEVPVLRNSWIGVADLDDVPPALRIVSALPSRLDRPAGAYSLELALELGDQLEASPVAYVVRVTTGLRTLAWISGTAETPELALTVPIRSRKPLLSVRVHLTASDSLGNESSLKSSMIVLPR